MSRPVRMCLGCRGRDDKAELVRVVTVSGRVEVDTGHNRPGRGAYLHRRPPCLDKAVTRKMFGRALRTEVDTEQAATAIRMAIGTVA